MIKKETATWNLQVPKALDKAVDEAIVRDWHYTKAEFIRDAVREKLKTLGINHLAPAQKTPVLEKHKKGERKPCLKQQEPI